MHLLYILLILLLVTRACSEIAVRFKQPSLVGELLGGVLLGILFANFADSSSVLAAVDTDETFQAVLDLAVFFLMLLAGIEMLPGELARAAGRSAPIAIVAMLVPLGLGIALGWWWLPESNWKIAQALFIGVALAITAVPVAVKVLLDLGQLQTRLGQVVVASAVIDDVLSLVLLAVLTSLITAGDTLTAGMLLIIGVNVLLFFAIAWALGRFLLPWLGARVRAWDLEHAEFSLLIIFGLALSVLAEMLSMHFLIGAFAAGVFFTRNVVGEDLHEKLTVRVDAVTMGFLAPVFFASIGMHLNLDAVTEAPLFLFLLLTAAIAGKVLGGGLVARATGFSTRHSLAIGAALNARGAVEIIIADIAFRAGLFDHPDPPPPAIEYLFSAIVIVAIITTLMSPIILRATLRPEK